MMELTLDQALQQGVEAHKAGQVQDADRLYTAILKAQPKHPDANHNMGVLAVGVGKVEQALPFFKTALEANQSIAQYWLSYIDALIKLDRIANAKSVLDQAKDKGAKGDSFDKLEEQLEGLVPASATVSKSQDPPQAQLQALINMHSEGLLKSALAQACYLQRKFPRSTILLDIVGAIYQGMGQLDAAAKSYEKAIKIKPEAMTYYNKGVILQQQGRLTEALQAYNHCLKLKPIYAPAYYNIGKLLQNQNESEQAIQAYKKTISIQPHYSEAHNNMGMCLHKQGKLEEARLAYNEAIEKNPTYYEAYNNLGNSLKELGRLEAAINAYKKSLEIQPQYADAYSNMGTALQEQGKLEDAIQAYNKALAIKPDYGNAKHLLASLTGKTTNSAPRAYVEPLFDAYANKFDQSLVEKLAYNIPKILTDLTVKLHGSGSLGSIIDLGCGTGLTGLEIKRFCSNLEGIDLSNQMLSQARIKNVYDKLSHIDIIEYLSNVELDFDYFISTDVFVYVGDLSEVFRLIKSRNKKPGKLVFSTEHSEKDGFHLEKSGRYSHSKGFIENLCKKLSYSISHFSETNLRKDRGVFLTGGLYILDF